MCFCPQSGASALSLAAQEGKVGVVRILIEAKALVNIQKKVYTPSHIHTVQPSLFHPTVPHPDSPKVGTQISRF